MKNEQVIDPEVDAGRRALLKLAGSAPAIGLIAAPRTSGAVVPEMPPSPPTTPWLEELPQVVALALSRGELTPAPRGVPNGESGECGRDKHQRWDEFFEQPELPPGKADLYELRAKEVADWVFHPAYPPQRVWGYEGNTTQGYQLNPTIIARYGQPIICRLFNDLPQDHVGFGTPEISMHLHNLHAPSESDGFPGDYFSASKAGPTLSAPGQFSDYFYPNVYAGLDQYGGIGDPREALGTLWYHDHTLDFTASNASRGLAGFYLLHDELDSGDEQDPNPAALKLPSHPYDYPLLFQDKRFDLSGTHYFDAMDPEGTFGDKITVNGKIEPVLRVARRRYRLRLLNAGPTRFYEFYLVTASDAVQSFSHIANDGNLLPAPLTRDRVRIAPAERADLVVNFANYPRGTVLYLVNRLRQESTRGPKDVRKPGTRVLKIVVDRDPPSPDLSRVPPALRPLPVLDPEDIAAAPIRRWEFARKGGLWTVNDGLVNVKSARATVRRGTAEIWELVNPSGGWSHPIHVHFEEGRILSKTVRGVPATVPLHEQGRKDVFVLGPYTTLRVFLRFRDFVGKYVMHCHNLPHEDHAMMVRWDIKD
ncbi:multicopper oxidase family protein [Methylotetracoccus oryzae]|uniref:multicopper oxidase family protein n=1 Tax=Methylotetracoccus oryzae TaxID=1919059 RepID=UPI0011198E04|nr:multicopper oxidase domain-containing protein [Methylotetracoccus oryzae]